MSKLSGRVFTASLKPSWEQEKITDFLELNKGAFNAYVITHDKDYDIDSGELIEPHTHFYIEYDTPRKITTVANLLKVEPNFIELARNKMGVLRYLTHRDIQTKAKYDNDQVYTNSETDYTTAIMASILTDKDIAQYILDGKGLSLLGVVPSGRLRTIQSFLHFDRSKAIQNEIENLNVKIDTIIEFTTDCRKMADSLALALKGVGSSLETSAKELANALAKIKYLK